MHLLILATLAATAAAMPSFIAVPADQIAFVDLSQLRARRVPRQTLQPPPPPPPAPLPNLYREEYQPIPLQYHQPIALAPQPEPQQARIHLQPPPQDVSGASTLGADALAERPPDFGEYVDFGAHTGDHGAFGWYADFPVNNHDDHAYRK